MTKKNGDSWCNDQKLVMSQIAENTKVVCELKKSIDKINEGFIELRSDQVKVKESLKELPQLKDSFYSLNTNLALAQAKIESASKISADVTEVKKLVGGLNREVGELQVKSGLWGALGGVISGVAIALTRIMK